MRSEPRPEFETDEADEAWSNSDRCLSADWKDPPHEVLDLVDGALKPFGLEIVTYECTGDSHDFRVDYAAEGRAKAEAFGPKARIPQTVEDALFWAVYEGIASKFEDSEIRKAVLGNSSNNSTIREVLKGLERRGFEIVRKEPSHG